MIFFQIIFVGLIFTKLKKSSKKSPFFEVIVKKSYFTPLFWPNFAIFKGEGLITTKFDNFEKNINLRTPPCMYKKSKNFDQKYFFYKTSTKKLKVVPKNVP